MGEVFEESYAGVGVAHVFKRACNSLVKLKGVDWHQISVGVVTCKMMCWFILVMMEG